MDDYNCRSQSDRVDESDQDDLEENEDGNYTVYECPGLAPVSMIHTHTQYLSLLIYNHVYLVQFNTTSHVYILYVTISAYNSATPS